MRWREMKNTLLHREKNAKLFSRPSKSAQPEKQQNLSEQLLRKQFGPKVTTKGRLTRPAHITGMFAQGMQSTYVVRDTMNEVSRAYLKEDLHHIIEMANSRRTSPRASSSRRPALFLQPEFLAGLDQSCDVDEPSPVLCPADRQRVNPVRHVAARGIEAAAHDSPEPRFSSGPSPPWDPRKGHTAAVPKLGQHTTLVSESSAESCNEGERSVSPACDAHQFMAACSDGAVATQDALAAINICSDWQTKRLHKLRQLYMQSRSRDVDQSCSLRSQGSKPEPERAGRAEASSQRSSSQQSTGVQTSPGLFSQASQPAGAMPSPATDSDVSSPDLGVAPITPSQVVLDPRRVLQMMSRGRGPSPQCCPSECSHRRPRRVVRTCCLDSSGNTCSSSSTCSLDGETTKSGAQQQPSKSEEDSPLVKYYCFRLH
ncbi:uncharacterized protein LOC134527856 isoform X2 [Bacillus rossius redtenbacheri]|uniref:uncharacterized protein LOC134527856 isoform X2 n=1 Tax=Bacillus rossius redtenbacheri TaxID=93214 RepID=UPI002FDCCFE2